MGVIYDIVGLCLAVGIIYGIRLMNSPATAVRGNLLGAGCVFAAIVFTLLSEGVLSSAMVWWSLTAGTVAGVLLAVKVSMTRIPQLVSLFNGLGGGASAIVAMNILLQQKTNMSAWGRYTAGVALVTGAITLSGSLIASAKLDEKMPQKPIVLKYHRLIIWALLCSIGGIVIAAGFLPNHLLSTLAVLQLVLALAFGCAFAIRIGGADMPITISLLNSLSGLAAAITGFAISNSLLVTIGAVVGAAGLLLTRIMCRAMNRSLIDVLTSNRLPAINSNGPINKDIEREARSNFEKSEPAGPKSIDEKALGRLIAKAGKVVFVPGYGMALAQAQNKIKGLYDKLQAQGKDVKFAIHPVAGRMPGHMNVLLAEVDIPYERLCQIDDINPEFKNTDLVIVVGANDVINPAANTAEGTPIYGMPILNVSEAGHIIICNKDTKAGYAGVDNPLYQNKENVTLLLGDASQTLEILIGQTG
jgi:NAD(P) transhydrogenase subunit beta